MPNKQTEVLTAEYIAQLNEAARNFVPPQGFISEMARHTGLARTNINRWFAGTADNRPIVPSKWVGETRMLNGPDFRDSDRKRLYMAIMLFDSLERNSIFEHKDDKSKTRVISNNGDTLAGAVKDGWDMIVRGYSMRFYGAAFSESHIVKTEEGWGLEVTYFDRTSADGSDQIRVPDEEDFPEEEEYFAPLECLEKLA